tara:strand:+ start:335 stop:505 length:171 start_codon:yes stop_codon:yes gene_type:complete
MGEPWADEKPLKFMSFVKLQDGEIKYSLANNLVDGKIDNYFRNRSEKESIAIFAHL